MNESHYDNNKEQITIIDIIILFMFVLKNKIKV